MYKVQHGFFAAKFKTLRWVLKLCHENLFFPEFALQENEKLLVVSLIFDGAQFSVAMCRLPKLSHF
jgi:hypothetical protein